MKLHTFAIDQLQKLSSKSWKQQEILVDQMIQSYMVNLKYIASLKSMTCEERIVNLQNTVKAWEENQFISMNLIKHLGVGMYQSWCICATLEHFYAAKELLDILPKDNLEEIDKLKKKTLVLPRLVEIMAKKRIEHENGGFPPSADDWRLVIESLDVQGKYLEAIEMLEGIDLTATSTRKIDDENDIKHHVGSLIQITEKEKLEHIAKLCIAAGDKDKAFHIYTNKLLKMMPDQWDYWERLMDCSECPNDIVAVIDSVCENDISRKVPIRGPRLARVALAAAQVREENDSSIQYLADNIIQYADLYSSLIYCCFQDLRKYLEILVNKTCNYGEISEPVKKVLHWAHMLRNGLVGGEVDVETNKEPRNAKLRMYITSIKICYELWHQLRFQSNNEQYINECISQFVPKPQEILLMWGRTSDLGTLPKDGGQKECLPGDDLILLLVQHLCLDDLSGRTWTKVLSLAILEHAIQLSPYNPYLKMTAINIYSNVGATARAFQIFEDLDIKQIQLDSCSYLILQRLVDGGLFQESIKQAGKIINLHTTSHIDLCKYMTKAFENGNIQKGREMLRWQIKNMTRSIQLLEAKGVIMDLAPFHNYGDSDDNADLTPIGLCHGLCGGDNDKERVEKMIRDSDNAFGAPSILRISANDMDKWSDNRDFDVNQYEILRKTDYHLDTHESIFRSHVHSVLCKLALFSSAVKPPKRGKVLHVNAQDILFQRGACLMTSVKRFEQYIVDNIALKRFSMLMIALSRTCAVLGAGTHFAQVETSDEVDEITTREKYCVSYLKDAASNAKDSIQLWKNYRNDTRTTLSRILPDILVHVFATFNITSKLLALFGWGKRKRDTKVVAACMVDVAEHLHSLIVSMKTCIMNDMLDDIDQNVERMRSMYPSKDVNTDLSIVQQIFEDMFPGDDMVSEVMHHIASMEKDLKSRLLAILLQMETEFHSFSVID